MSTFSHEPNLNLTSSRTRGRSRRWHQIWPARSSTPFPATGIKPKTGKQPQCLHLPCTNRAASPPSGITTEIETEGDAGEGEDSQREGDRGERNGRGMRVSLFSNLVSPSYLLWCSKIPIDEPAILTHLFIDITYLYLHAIILHSFKYIN